MKNTINSSEWGVYFVHFTIDYGEEANLILVNFLKNLIKFFRTHKKTINHIKIFQSK